MLDCFLSRIRRDRHTVPFRAREHTHEFDELTYFIAGEGSTRIADAAYPYRGGSFAFYRAGTLHDEDDPEPTDVIWLHVRCALPELALREGVFGDPRDELRPILIKLLRLARGNDPWRGVLVESCLSEALATAARLQSMPTETGGVTDWEEVLEEIDERCSEDIDFAALAARCHYSYDRFRHLFRARFGASPHAYLIRRRVERAALLLHRTNGSLTEIALDCGFSSASQFSALFKQHTGLSPRAYRAAPGPSPAL